MTPPPYYTVNGPNGELSVTLQHGSQRYEATVGGWLVRCHVAKPIWQSVSVSMDHPLDYVRLCVLHLLPHLFTSRLGCLTDGSR